MHYFIITRTDLITKKYEIFTEDINDELKLVRDGLLSTNKSKLSKNMTFLSPFLNYSIIITIFMIYFV